jgi:pimeloyl-ACP methyl ester carboxylesterase
VAVKEALGEIGLLSDFDLAEEAAGWGSKAGWASLPPSAVEMGAEEFNWPRLYDPDTLAAGEIPAAAIIYANDPYVDRTLSEQTAARIPRLQTWITDELEHNGLRADGSRVLDHLLGLVRNRV